MHSALTMRELEETRFGDHIPNEDLVQNPLIISNWAIPEFAHRLSGLPWASGVRSQSLALSSAHVIRYGILRFSASRDEVSTAEGM